jgi:hypothetical protein
MYVCMCVARFQRVNKFTDLHKVSYEIMLLEATQTLL